MKKKKVKTETPAVALGITREIRSFFREREVKRIERYKNEIKLLKEELSSVKHGADLLRYKLSSIKKGLSELYTNSF